MYTEQILKYFSAHKVSRIVVSSWNKVYVEKTYASLSRDMDLSRRTIFH